MIGALVDEGRSVKLPVFYACDLLRPFLFFVLLGYIPRKFGIGFDVTGKPPSAAEVNEKAAMQLQHISKIGVSQRVPDPDSPVSDHLFYDLADRG